MPTYQWDVAGEPVATQRARVTRNGTFTPKRSLAAQHAVLAAFLAAYGATTPDDQHEWAVTITAYRKHRRRQDVDNVAKTALDAMTGTLWADDSQVTRLWVVATHRWPDGRNQPGLTVVAYPTVLGYWTKPTQERNDP